jgi:dTDP-D-glucose 4,6-dehydratase
MFEEKMYNELVTLIDFVDDINVHNQRYAIDSNKVDAERLGFNF